MKLLYRNSRWTLTMSSVATLALMAGAAQIAAASDPVEGPYAGTATLCAIDRTGMTVEQRGKSGITYTYNQVLLFRIDADPNTDNDLMHGWETLTSNTKATSAGGGYSWGEAVLEPDDYAGTLVDNFKFPVKQSENISGTYEGTGALDGVTVDYALAPAMPGTLPETACQEVPWTCGPFDPTNPAPTTCEYMPPGVGYFMSGWVN